MWIASSTKRIYSKMFDNEEKALAFANSKKDCIVFRLLKQKRMQEFSWTLLPYGKYKLYEKALKLYKRRGGGVIEKLLGA